MKTALKNIRRTPYQALAAVLVLSFNLFIVAVFLLVTLASQVILTHFETRPQVIAYLQDNASESDINQTIANIMATGQATNIKYISKDEALKIYKQSVGNDPLLLGTITDLGEVTAQILPASLEVSVKSSNSFDAVVGVFENSNVVSTTPQGQKEIDFPKNVIVELIRWTQAIRTAGLGLVFILSLTSIITIATIISIKIAARRGEIDTLKLIGARNSFVTKPYLWESIFYSIAGAFFGWLMAYIILLYSTPFLVSHLSGIIPLPVSPLTMFYLLFVLLSISLILGLFSGLFAVVRFLRR